MSNYRDRLKDIAYTSARRPFHGNVIGLKSNLHPIVDLFPEWSLENWDNRWCGAFVYYCCVEAGYDIPVKHPSELIRCNFAGCAAWDIWAKLEENGFFYANGNLNFTPQGGDIVLYDHVFLDEPHDHIGIVIENCGNHLIVAEGNVGNTTAIVERPIDLHVRGYIRLPDDLNKGSR